MLRRSFLQSLPFFGMFGGSQKSTETEQVVFGSGVKHIIKNSQIIYSEFDNGLKTWFKNHKYHREDGPAIEYSNGVKSWWLNGKCHREDGPAVVHPSGYQAWYLNSELMTEEEWKKAILSKKQS